MQCGNLQINASSAQASTPRPGSCKPWPLHGLRLRPGGLPVEPDGADVATGLSLYPTRPWQTPFSVSSSSELRQLDLFQKNKLCMHFFSIFQILPHALSWLSLRIATAPLRCVFWCWWCLFHDQKLMRLQILRDSFEESSLATPAGQSTKLEISTEELNRGLLVDVHCFFSLGPRRRSASRRQFAGSNVSF